MPYFKKLILLTLLLFITACNNEASLKDACLMFPEMCQKIKPDGMCKAKRNDVFMSRYSAVLSNSERQKFKLLIALEDYIDCAQRASYIEYIDPIEKARLRNIETGKVDSPKDIEKRKKYAESLLKRKTDRQESYYYAKETLEVLTKSFQNPSDPYMMYWYWSRNKDHKAIRKLITLDKERKLEQHDLIYYVAQEYIKRDPVKAQDALFRSLEKYPTDEYKAKVINRNNNKDFFDDKGLLHFSIFRSLSKMYYKNRNYHDALIYALLLVQNNDQTANIPMIKDVLLKNNPNYDFSKAENTAQKIHEKLKKGTFKHS